ncbi:MAG: hypoxanthine phosphoribosyltransferase [Dysgonamonadaceae bacterium]|nr:hypoxanthine phosphoribosyltransferase [Dysgonamonadaceae bacterium]
MAQNKIIVVKKVITVKDKQFDLFIEQAEIEQNIKNIAARMNAELDGKRPVFLVVLNGAFMFAADLMKEVTIPSEITFVRLASYEGTSSTNSVKQVLGLNECVKDRIVVIVEDIVDTGNTMVALLKELEKHEPKEVKVATLLLKPDALKQQVPLDYVVLEIPNEFILGYGLDYDGYGRNLKDIYKIK